MLEGINLLSLSSQRMRYLTQRQSLINQNIAKADVPGYQSKDLGAFNVPNPLLQTGGAGSAPPLQMAATSAGHVGFGLTGSTSVKIDRNAHSYSEKPNANNVSVEEQMVKANDVANAFDMASTAYGKTIGLFRAAMGGAG